jgi:hypothetical protein
MNEASRVAMRHEGQCHWSIPHHNHVSSKCLEDKSLKRSAPNDGFASGSKWFKISRRLQESEASSRVRVVRGGASGEGGMNPPPRLTSRIKANHESSLCFRHLNTSMTC